MTSQKLFNDGELDSPGIRVLKEFYAIRIPERESLFWNPSATYCTSSNPKQYPTLEAARHGLETDCFADAILSRGLTGKIIRVTVTVGVEEV